MHWVIQNNIFQEEGYQELIDSVKRLNIPHTIVKVVPFAHEVIPEINTKDDIIVFGSVVMSKIAKKYKWYPGTYLNDNFDLAVWSEKYNGDLLNDYNIIYVRDLKNMIYPSFIRPINDSKSFTGYVRDPMDLESCQQFHDNLSLNGMDSNTKIAWSTPKQISKEFRFFVVSGRIVTSTQYKLNGKFALSEDVDRGASWFASAMIQKWQPNRAFVLDIALVDEEYKIVEIGCINHAGFYKANVRKIVEAIHKLEILK